ncbi:MAG: hypothetical protein H5T69_09465 [Chloroflexi bacterium]|nr:hypothetical protein [Chloroflexota bacterium]
MIWEAIDDAQAGATLSDGATTIELVFQFDARGLIASARSDERYRQVGEKQVATPWRGRFWNYAPRGRMRIPLDGGVAWLFPAGPRPYWRGHIQRIEYEYK